MFRKFIIISVLIIEALPLLCQTAITGRVMEINGESLTGATLVIDGAGLGYTTDSDGYFEILDPPLGNLILHVSFVGYEKKNIPLFIQKDKTTDIEVKLEPNNEVLEEVVVVGKTKEQIKREEPIKIEVIDINEAQARSVSLPQLFNQVSGVKVRQNGGVGSGTVININGLQGNAIRLFRDGVPLDYLGSAFNLSLLPIDQLSNIEIYKGVLPVELGADALGGAVNFITRENNTNNLTVSYSYGSFNTHLATVNAYVNIPRTKLFTSVSSYYVYSDNDYKILANIEDDFTGNVKEQEVERFHGAVDSKFLEFKTGVKNTKLADLFEVGAAFSGIDKERQNDFRMNHVFGEVMYYEDAKIVTTHYKKNIRKLDINIFGAYSNLNTLNDDTPEYSYNWSGEATPYETEGHPGESGEAQSYKKMEFDNGIVRANLNYNLTENHKLTFNHNFIYYDRTGSNAYRDPYSNDSVDVLTIPAEYIRNISGLGITSGLFNKRITNVFTIKRYDVTTSSVAAAYEYYGEVPEVSDRSYGIGNSIKYSFSTDRYIRFSYEKATRIPDSKEYLGEPERDIMGNPELIPERSNNINLGFYTNLNKSKTFWIDFNSFYRYITNHIVLQTYTLFQSRYENTDDTRIIGSEFTLKAKPIPVLSCNLSLTYQDIRRENIQDIKNRLQADARRPNIPYFFGNLGVKFSPEKTFFKGYWQFYGNYAYVEQYLLNSIPKSEEPALFGTVDSDANLIPTQNIVDVGLTYKIKGIPIWINAEINNLLNTKAYDGFRVQKPGRNYRLKLKYSFN